MIARFHPLLQDLSSIVHHSHHSGAEQTAQHFLLVLCLAHVCLIVAIICHKIIREMVSPYQPESFWLLSSIDWLKRKADLFGNVGRYHLKLIATTRKMTAGFQPHG